jgi:hypothetical protein
LKHVVENIENYLCYIFNSQKDHDNFSDIVEELVAKTFAYHLGNDEQKEALSVIFQLIAQKIMSDIKPEKISYYAKSLYGIDVSNRVLSWIDEKNEELENSSDDQLLVAISNLFVQLFPNLSKINADELISVARLWMSGETYVGIYNAQQGTLNMSQIEKLCISTISYNMSLLIGNILDAIDNQAEELSEQLAMLQKMIKYGVSSRFQILICENLFDERILAKQFDDAFGQAHISEKELKQYMTANNKKALKILEQYTDYFNYKFRLFIRRS